MGASTPKAQRTKSSKGPPVKGHAYSQSGNTCIARGTTGKYIEPIKIQTANIANVTSYFVHAHMPKFGHKIDTFIRQNLATRNIMVGKLYRLQIGHRVVQLSASLIGHDLGRDLKSDLKSDLILDLGSDIKSNLKSNLRSNKKSHLEQILI